ncbi:MAG: STAS domain-containing protein [Roseiflexus sp.]|nr:STAS domain-containing protein [Roseiflexus sp.]MCS7289139.1 STAS domain-containing protein [Roseiflexus sp.]MDW8145245.1 STAS domain-containing protein [Roseiflexaceae bacterium]MDW8233155.1 STAS domain-containing protein [Roseiflexaceae bacterium]
MRPIDDAKLFSNVIERQQAPALQRILIAISSAALVALIVFLATLGVNPTGGVPAAGAVVVMLTSIGGVIVLRYGRFRLAVLVASAGLVGAVLFVTVIYGYPAATPFLLVTLIPVILTGLLVETSRLIAVSAASGLIPALIWLLKPAVTPFVAAVQPPGDLTVVAVALFLLVLFVVTTIIALFGPVLRQSLAAALVREQELDRLRASLETTVQERTAALQEALRTVEQREAQLQQTLADLRASQEAIRELSAPVLPVLPGILVAPLIGAIDAARAEVFVANVLHAIERERAHHIIFDITGVPIVDTHVARMILQAADAARLLGAQVIVVGIRPEVAQTVVSLGVALEQIRTFANLQQAISALRIASSADMRQQNASANIDARLLETGDA